MFLGALFFLCLGRDPYDIPVSVFNAEVQGDAVDFLNQIDPHTIRQIPVSSYEMGYDAVKRGETKALISIGANFTRALIARAIDHEVIDDETINMGMINVSLDMSCKFDE